MSRDNYFKLEINHPTGRTTVTGELTYEIPLRVKAKIDDNGKEFESDNTDKVVVAAISDILKITVYDFFLLAGNNQQARDYCNAKGIHLDPGKIVHSPNGLRGRERGQTIRFVGTYEERPDILEMYEKLIKRNWKIEYDSY